MLIGLREGLEASIVVGILVAYLVKSGHREKVRHVWAGVAAALAVSVGLWAVITFTSRNMTFEEQELFGGTLSIVAVAFVTWMVLWMKKAARSIAGDLRGRLDTALTIGSWAVAGTAFLAVGREGLETAVILWAAAQSTGGGSSPLVGASVGLAAAVVLGYLLYRGALGINLSRFFTWTGAALIVVAAGVLAYGVHDLQEARFLPGLNDLAFDVSDSVDMNTWYGALLKGIFNFSPATTKLEAAAWLLYAVPVMALFLVGARRRSTTPAAPSRAVA